MFIFILILINSHFLEFDEFKFAFDLRLRVVNVILKFRNFDIFFDNFHFRACDSCLCAKLLKFDFHARFTFYHESKNVEIVVFVCDSSWSRNVLMLRFHLTCLRQRESRSRIWSKVHDARRMIQTSRVHDVHKMIQANKIHDAHKVIQTSRAHDVHKMKSLSKVFFYCYKVANDQRNSFFYYCVQFKLST